MKIPYLDIILDSKEQAAGFPPFTRGYQEYAFTPEIISAEKSISFDYTLKSNSADSIWELFLHILKNKKTNPTFHLLLDITVDFELIVLTKTLRTLLALTNHLNKKNSSLTKFHFYLKNNNSQSILNTHIYLKMSQINTFILTQEEQFLLENIPNIHSPIDPLYGSKLLQKKVELLTTSVWEKIHGYFIS